MNGKASVGAGDVSITIDGKDYVLRPTLGAAMALSKNGGLRAAVDRCLNLDMEQILLVVQQGLGRNSRDLAEKVYTTGLNKISAPCITFLTNLSNGGLPYDDGEEGKDVPLGSGSP